MSWWWKSRAAPSNEKLDDTPVAPPSALEEPPITPVDATPAPDPIQRTLNREEQAEQEWFALLKELQAEANADPTTKARTKTTVQHETASQTTAQQIDLSPNSFYPTEMSCRSSFDYAMFCQSFGGQFVNVYRYGAFRSCSNHWDDFWLCMRTRQWNKEDRQKAIQEHYRKKAVKWKTGPSSEDVWEVRTEPVKNPISGNFVELEAELAQLKENSPAV